MINYNSFFDNKASPKFVQTNKISAFNFPWENKFGLNIKVKILEEFHCIIISPKQIFQVGPFPFKFSFSQPGNSAFMGIL